MHLGLGDTIVLSGAIVTLSELHGKIIVPCYQNNEVSVRSFFVNHPAVWVRVVTNETEMENTRQPGDLACGYYHEEKPREGELFDSWTYRQLDVPLEKRWSASPIHHARFHVPQVVVPIDPYAFVHDDVLRNFVIPKGAIAYPVRQPSPKGSILTWCSQIHFAHEVHVINSAFWHLAEAINPAGVLYLHKYARREFEPVNFCTMLHPWKVLEAPFP